MDFGALGDYFEVAVAKNLSGTDVNRMVGHGHELGGFCEHVMGLQGDC